MNNSYLCFSQRSDSCFVWIPTEKQTGFCDSLGTIFPTFHYLDNLLTPFSPKCVKYIHGSIALCGYPIGKMEIRDSSQISTTAPIFQQYNYFRQNLEENVTFTFYFFSFASNFPCKICDGQIHAWKNIGKYLYILNIKIHNEGLPP